MVSVDSGHNDKVPGAAEDLCAQASAETAGFVPASLAGIAPLVVAVAKPVAVSVAEDEVHKSTEKADNNEKEGEKSCLESVRPAVENEPGKEVKIEQVQAILALSADEEGACLEFIRIVRQFPEIIAGIALTLDTENAQRLADICIHRLFARWSCDYVSLICLIEASASLSVSGVDKFHSTTRNSIPFIQHLLRAICDSFDVISFGRHVVQAAGMHELEFLLTHPSNDIDVQTVCRLTVEPMLLRLFESSRVKEDASSELDHNRGMSDRVAKVPSMTNGSTPFIASSSSQSTSVTSPPLILRATVVGLVRALGQTRALFEMATPFCSMLLNALVVTQQNRHSRVLRAAGMVPQNLVFEGTGARNRSDSKSGMKN